MTTLKEIDKEIHDIKQRHIKELTALFKKRKEIHDKNQRINSNSYNKRKALLEETGEWLRGRLNEGDIIKVTGSRAGPYREIVTVCGDYIIGKCVRWDKKHKEWKTDHKTTEQGLSKITAIWRNGEFVKIKDWMND